MLPYSPGKRTELAEAHARYVAVKSDIDAKMEGDLRKLWDQKLAALPKNAVISRVGGPTFEEVQAAQNSLPAAR